MDLALTLLRGWSMTMRGIKTARFYPRSQRIGRMFRVALWCRVWLSWTCQYSGQLSSQEAASRTFSKIQLSTTTMQCRMSHHGGPTTSTNFWVTFSRWSKSASPKPSTASTRFSRLQRLFSASSSDRRVNPCCSDVLCLCKPASCLYGLDVKHN